jgi:hypothetical protein
VSVRLAALERLEPVSCSRLERLPDDLGHMQALTSLDCEGRVSLVELPSETVSLEVS